MPGDEISTEWSDRMALTPGLVEVRLGYYILDNASRKNSHCGKLCKEETAHMFITSQTKLTLSYSMDSIHNHQSPSEKTSVDTWNLDGKLSRHFRSLR